MVTDILLVIASVAIGYLINISRVHYWENQYEQVCNDLRTLVRLDDQSMFQLRFQIDELLYDLYSDEEDE